MTIYNEPPPGMCLVPDKDDMTKVSIKSIWHISNVKKIKLCIPYLPGYKTGFLSL